MGREGLGRTALAMQNRVVDIELLVIPECPHADAAGVLLRTALDDVGLGVLGYEVMVLRDDDAVRDRSFAGSPTFLADGSDLFPGASDVAALACRTYATASGRHGLPDLPDLRRALMRAAGEAPAMRGGSK